jgi:hypothetical protein
VRIAHCPVAVTGAVFEVDIKVPTKVVVFYIIDVMRHRRHRRGVVPLKPLITCRVPTDTPWALAIFHSVSPVLTVYVSPPPLSAGGKATLPKFTVFVAPF